MNIYIFDLVCVDILLSIIIAVDACIICVDINAFTIVEINCVKWRHHTVTPVAYLIRNKYSCHILDTGWCQVFECYLYAYTGHVRKRISAVSPPSRHNIREIYSSLLNKIMNKNDRKKKKDYIYL